jgi:hypothetical protein
MYGVRVLHNFGRLGLGSQCTDPQAIKERAKRVDEEDAVDGGLKGRVSAGAELYFSAKEKSAGGWFVPFWFSSAKLTSFAYSVDGYTIYNIT